MFKTADVYCSEITFFHNDALLSKGTRKLFCTKSVREKWNMKMYLKLQLQVPSQDLQPTTRKNSKEIQ